MNWGAYWRLMRFHKPVGILLLWYPTAWALWTANKGFPPLGLLALFLVGTTLMRAAGCVINDIADRHVDKHVARTKMRPLTSGELRLTDAFAVLICLLFGALIVLVNLPAACFPWALVALVITFIYPFCKRFFDAPQLVLGLAFSMGIPMSFVASNVALNSLCLILFVLNFAWIVAYDTMYAMTDIHDDKLIGVRSTAIFFGRYDLLSIGLLLSLMQALWLCWAFLMAAGPLFFLGWLVASLILVYQHKLIKHRVPAACFSAFLISAYYGGVMWIAVMVA